MLIGCILSSHVREAVHKFLFSAQSRSRSATKQPFNYTRFAVVFTDICCSMATSSNMCSSDGLPDFSEPWMFSDVVLVVKDPNPRVKDRKFHVHRFVLAMWSPVFRKMFSSEFKEKSMTEIPLPEKKASEFEELLLIIYPAASEKGWKTITNENCYFLYKLADEYQMDAIKQRCESFLVDKVKNTSGKTFLNELGFAQTHQIETLINAIVHKTVRELRLDDFKSHEIYNDIKPDIYKQIVEGMVKKYEGINPIAYNTVPVWRPL